MPLHTRRANPIMPMKPLDAIFHRRRVKNSLHYFTEQGKDSGATVRLRYGYNTAPDQLLLAYTRYNRRRKDLSTAADRALPVHEKHTTKTAEHKGISNRLRIPRGPDEVRTVLNTHPEYFKVIEGRPLRRNDDIKRYISDIRAYFMMKKQTGYKLVQIMDLDFNVDEETDIYMATMNEMKQHITNFHKFLMDDYGQVQLYQARAKSARDMLELKEAEYMNIISDESILINQVLAVEVERDYLKLLREFLVHVAPPTWKERYDEHFTVCSPSNDDFGLKRREVSRRFLACNLVHCFEIDDVLESAKNEFKNPPGADLYFSRPEQIMKIFESMEFIGKELLIYLSRSETPRKMLKQRSSSLVRNANHETFYYRIAHNKLSQNIQLEEANADQMEAQFKRILNNLLHYFVVADWLKLKCCLGFVFENVAGKEVPSDFYELMKHLEWMYEQYNVLLDDMDFEVVTLARTEVYSADLKMMHRAHQAQKELKAYEHFRNTLLNVFTPPAKFQRPPVPKFVRPKKKISRESVAGKPLALTADEREGLWMFTEWCEGEDPELYLEKYREIERTCLCVEETQETATINSEW